MKIRMKIQLTGTRDGVAWPPRGGTVDLPDYEAARMCERGFADPVVDKVEERRPDATATEDRKPAAKKAEKRA